MEPQNQEIVASGSPAEVPNDPGKMFIGGLSWQTSPARQFNNMYLHHQVILDGIIYFDKPPLKVFPISYPHLQKNRKDGTSGDNL